MIGLDEKSDVLPGIRYFGPARIIERNETDRQVRVQINKGGNEDGAVFTWAYPTLPVSSKLSYGDTVLVAGERINEFYVIGLISQNTRQESTHDRLVMACGVQAQKSGRPDEEKLQIISQQGALIFEYDSSTGKSRVDIPSGDLEITTKNGNIDFTSAHGIRFSSVNPIELQSSEKVQFAVTDSSGSTSTAVSLDSQTINMKSPELVINAQKGKLAIEDTHYSGKRITTVFVNVKCVMDRFESATVTVIEKLKNVYRSVEGLTQLRTGRMRTVVDTTYQFKSRKAFLKAEEEFKIKGDKIYLG